MQKTYKNYFIKAGYQINPLPRQYFDSEEDAVTYQIKVYEYAARLAQKYNVGSILDIGCGYALKVKEFLAPLCSKIVGIDTAHAINYCTARHDFGRWYVDDIENPTLHLAEGFDLILSVDVIEHLVAPDTLLTYIRTYSKPTTLVVLSTPERDLRRGKQSMGPPGNAAHVREWNQVEFAAYLTDRGLKILEHHIMDLREGMCTCQTVLTQFA